MDVAGIKNYIIDNPDTIVLLLESAGFEKIKSRTNEIRCARDEDSNPTAVKINPNTLGSICFSTNLKGDLITLLQAKLGYSFTQTLRWIVTTLNLSESMFKSQEVIMPFGGYFKKIGKSCDELLESQIYPPVLINEYKSPPNIRFFKDGISFSTQDKFKIGYDSFSKRITIPWFNTMGELIGIMGRLNKDELDDGELKYLPIIPFRKDNALYGYDINYTDIVGKDICIITEAEKGVMQLDSMKLPYGIGLGGNAITEARANLVKGLGVSRIILAFDEGLELDLIKDNANRLKTKNAFITNNVGYIYDPKNEVMSKGSKCSPTDLGVRAFQKLLKEYTVWV